VEADGDDGRRWRILLDLGSGAVGPLQRYVSFDQIDAILLSHLHPDHCVDLCGFYVALRYNPAGPPRRKVPVHGPGGTAERLESMYGIEQGPGLTAIYDVREWQEGEPVRIGPFSVTPHLVDHPIESYGMRVEEHRDGRSVVLAYSGDTDSCPGLITVAKDADVLLAEAAFCEGRDHARHIHLTGARAGRSAHQAGARRLLLTHLPVWTSPVTALAEARSTYGGPVELVTPGSVHEI
jgi:ribonuclease BN (tRNA processing enzyme)